MILSRLCYNNETLYCQCTNVPHEEGVYQAGECNNRISLTVPESGLPGSFSSACFNDNMSTGSTVDWYEPDDGDVKEKQRNITALLWPTPSGINENGARNFCIGRLRQTTFWNVCGQITGVNLSRTIDTCVGDIKVSTH